MGVASCDLLNKEIVTALKNVHPVCIAIASASASASASAGVSTGAGAGASHWLLTNN